MLMIQLNTFVRKYMKVIELVAVVMRICGFSLVSWLGAHRPFHLVWVVNTTDAVGLSWCAVQRKDLAYTVPNVLWMIIGAVGILRTVGVF
jgi:hypothetical protein